MDAGQTNTNSSIVFYWFDEQTNKLLLTLCDYLIIPPVHLMCCGQCIYERFEISKYYYLLIH